MTSSLPQEIQAVFERFLTTEYTTVDSAGQPITWPLTPYYRPGDPCIDVTTGLGYPKKANDARRNPKVSLLFSDPTGSGLHDPPMVLVQGTAEVDDRDLEANRKRYERELVEKLPGAGEMTPPGFIKPLFSWYYTRIYVHVRPERIYTWPGCDVTREPELWDAHMEEVRSGHDEEVESEQARPAGGQPVWDGRLEEMARRHRSAVVSVTAPDGFPFAVRLPISVDSSERVVWLEAEPVGVPLTSGIACVTAHDHDERFTYQRNFQVRGDLIERDGRWGIQPHKLVGGFELPPGSLFDRLRLNYAKTKRFRRVAKRELARRAERER
ncbi:MAG TPA: pyridoxamine 5'-phosphate oxidase family protein [Thermoleophilaceae bacterium]|nr:pyridoxamine 5'-phosphate oxidase family protein [Thermoleophilaceae bacterium]